MKLTATQINGKKRLNKAIASQGFHEIQKITELSGSSLGQYCGLDCDKCLPRSKLELVEATIKLKSQS